jgi:hypothetical protein
MEVKAENLVGSVDPAPRVLSWRSHVPAGTDNRTLFVANVSRAERSIAFQVEGWGSHAYKWRLDGSPWAEALESRRYSHSGNSPGVTHYWEALPLEVEAIWSGPPLMYSWTEADSTRSLRRLSVVDSLSIPLLSDGIHRLVVKAVDSAGGSCHMLAAICCSYI